MVGLECSFHCNVDADAKLDVGGKYLTQGVNMEFKNFDASDTKTTNEGGFKTSEFNGRFAQ